MHSYFKQGHFLSSAAASLLILIKGWCKCQGSKVTTTAFIYNRNSFADNNIVSTSDSIFLHLRTFLTTETFPSAAPHHQRVWGGECQQPHISGDAGNIRPELNQQLLYFINLLKEAGLNCDPLSDREYAHHQHRFLVQQHRADKALQKVTQTAEKSIGATLPSMDCACSVATKEQKESSENAAQTQTLHVFTSLPYVTGSMDHFRVWQYLFPCTVFVYFCWGYCIFLIYCLCSFLYFFISWL